MKTIHLVKDIQEADRKAIENGTSAIELMRRAAEGIFNSVKWNGNILIVTGKGNNGGDGYALASILNENGYPVSIMELDDKRTETSQFYYDRCKEQKIAIVGFDHTELHRYDMIVDCIFGVGFKGSLKEPYRNAVESINASGKYVISVDANSGMNLNCGMTDLAIKSDVTISISELKPGYYLNYGKDNTGNITNVDIGLKTAGKEIVLLEKEDVSPLFKRRPNMSNKGDFGYVGILGGCESYPGAIKLANLGQNALYAGCGVSRIIVPDIIKETLYKNVLESTIYPVPSFNGHMKMNESSIDSSLKHLKAISIGMGWGTSDDNGKILEYILKTKTLKVVVDADGLNTLSKMNLEILNETKCEVILTPHAKEFSRLLSLGVEEIQNDPIGKIEEFVSKYNVTLLLKGPTTIIANKDKMYFVDRGCPGMATAGSGDVLSGILAGILGYLDCDLTLAVAAGAYINGLAGEIAEKEYGDIGMVSSDTARCVSKAIKTLQ